jgi:regulatory protein
VRIGRHVVANVAAERAHELGVAPGTPWTEELCNSLQDAHAAAQARAYALRSLAARARTRKSLMESIEKRGHTRGTAERVADALERMGLLDDRAFAEMAVRGELSRKPCGRRLLLMKLRKRGVPDSIAEEAVDAALVSRDEAEDAFELASRRARTMQPSVAPEARRRRLYGLLARRGFSSGACAQAVRRIERITEAVPDDAL